MMQPRINPAAERVLAAERVAAAGPGRLLAAGIVLLGVALAVFAVWFQWRQTRRCLDFYGVDAARRIQSAARVELWEIQGATALDRLEPASRRDVTLAGGLVHLRRGLVEDANFDWGAMTSSAADAGEERRAGPRTWDVAIAFLDHDAPRVDEGERSPDHSATEGHPATEHGAAAGAGTVIVIDFDPSGGALAVVGRPGVVGLGRIRKGLRTWIDATLAAGDR